MLTIIYFSKEYAMSTLNLSTRWVILETQIRANVRKANICFYTECRKRLAHLAAHNSA